MVDYKYENYKYSVGDRVLVRSDLSQRDKADRYKMVSGDYVGGFVTNSMQYRFAGKIVTISKIEGAYRIVEDGGLDYFVDEMFVNRVGDGECYCETLL